MRKLFPLMLGTALVAATAACPVRVPKANPLPEWNEDLRETSAELARRLNDPRVVVLHVGRDRASYDAGHVPGARFLPLSAIVAERNGIPNELPSVQQLEEAFEAVGVSDNSRVILYGDLQGLLAARAFFTLDYLGHANHAILDGGLERWRADERPVSTEVPSARRGSLTPRPHADLVVTAEWVRDHLNDTSVVFVDARPAAEFSGATPGEGVTRPGHIPGAHNLFWRNSLISETDPRLRSPEVLATAYTLAEASQDDTVVVYCRTGVQASHAYYVARYLERKVKMYDASFIEWSRRGADYPVER
ncbi:MAG TPA: sulfurtransferase [Longimicrobium sp.]|nr:sulfurtransferase [Longimicrobium sp.]